MENLKTDLEQDEVFVFTPKGRVISLPVGATTGRLRLRRAHRGRPHVHRRQGQRPAGVARSAAAQRRHVRDLHLQARVRRAVARLAAVRRVAAGAQQDPAVVLPRAARRHDRDRPRRADQGVPPRGAAGAAHVEERCVDRPRSRPPGYADLDALLAAIGENHVSARSFAQKVARDVPRRATTTRSSASVLNHARPRAQRQAAGRARRGPRRRARSGCRSAARRCPATRSSASSPAAVACRCTAPTAPTPRA